MASSRGSDRDLEGARSLGAGLIDGSSVLIWTLIFVFLILAAQYESWSLPFSVLLCTPIAVVGAFAALIMRVFKDDVYGQSSVVFENNVFAQIGLVMLIGLAAKNTILIV